MRLIMLELVEFSVKGPTRNTATLFAENSTLRPDPDVLS